MLGTWIKHGGMRQQESHTTRFPAVLILGHFLLAAAGLLVWIVFVVTDIESLAWVAFVVLLPVALLGFTMLVRWVPTYRSRVSAVQSASGTSSPPEEQPAERHLPLPVVIGHGLFAVATLILGLLTALGVGGA
jgi:hypothetical protein